MPPTTYLSSVALVWATCIAWSLAHERLATVAYDGAAFNFSGALNLAQAVTAALFSTAAAWRGGRGPPPPSTWFRYAAIAAAHTAGSPLGFRAIHYLDYPLAILSSSLKIVPLMLLGWVVGRRYSSSDLLATAGIALGVGLYAGSLGGAASPAVLLGMPRGQSTAIGLSLLSFNLLMDAAVSLGQDALFCDPVTTPSHWVAMASLNWVSSGLLSGALASGWLLYGADSEAARSVSFLIAHPLAAVHLLAFAAAGTAAQAVIYASVQAHGSFRTALATMTRKFVSILLSVALYRHHLAPQQWVGVHPPPVLGN